MMYVFNGTLYVWKVLGGVILLYCYIKKFKEMTHQFEIDGMTCGSCIANIINALQVVSGIEWIMHMPEP